MSTDDAEFGMDVRYPAPPFSRKFGPLGDEAPRDATVFPAMVQTPGGRFLVPKQDLNRYFQLELDVSRLNRMHDFLWLAGLPRGARPLHKQILLERRIVVTEQADLHLVWLRSRFFVKPLPRFLLTREYWLHHLCKDQALYQSACGFLLSYAWLVSHRSDLKIASELGLFPTCIAWEQWTDFVADFLLHVDLGSPHSINERYRFGELRLLRLNWIFRCTLQSRSIRTLKAGYFQGPDWYTQFLKDNFGWFIAVFAYLSIVLSAMQVALGTQRLAGSSRFETVSAGFSIFSIAMPVIVVGLMVITTAITVFWNINATRKYNRRVAQNPENYLGPDARSPNSWTKLQNPQS